MPVKSPVNSEYTDVPLFVSWNTNKFEVQKFDVQKIEVQTSRLKSVFLLCSPAFTSETTMVTL